MILLLVAGCASAPFASADAVVRSDAMLADTLVGQLVEDDHIRPELEIDFNDVADGNKAVILKGMQIHPVTRACMHGCKL